MVSVFPQPYQPSPAIFQPRFNGPCPGTYVGRQSFISHGQGNSPWTNYIHRAPSQGQPTLEFGGHQLPAASAYGRQGQAPTFKPVTDGINRLLASTNLCGLQREADSPQKSSPKDGRQDVLRALNADAPSFRPQEIDAMSGDHEYYANYRGGLTQPRGGKQENRDLSNEMIASIKNAGTVGEGSGPHKHNSGDNNQGPVVTSVQLNSGPSASRALHKRISSLRAENIPPCGVTRDDGSQAYSHHSVSPQIVQVRGAGDNGEPNQAGATKKLSNQPLVVHSSNAPRGRMADWYTWRDT